MRAPLVRQPSASRRLLNCYNLATHIRIAVLLRHGELKDGGRVGSHGMGIGVGATVEHVKEFVCLRLGEVNLEAGLKAGVACRSVTSVYGEVNRAFVARRTTVS